MTWLYQLNQSYIFIIFQELDKHWRIMTETAIKAKSIKGYSTYNRNIFWENSYMGFILSIHCQEADGEQVEAWDC